MSAPPSTGGARAQQRPARPSIAALNKLLPDDYRGILVSTIQKRMPADSIFVLIDEAHRTTGGDLGNYVMAVGFTGTPVDLTKYGEGTFETFGTADAGGYTHKCAC